MVQQIQVKGEQIILGSRGALVASQSQPGGWHVVRDGQCDCRGFQYRGRCRHVTAVAAAQQPDDADYWYQANVAALRGAT